MGIKIDSWKLLEGIFSISLTKNGIFLVIYVIYRKNSLEKKKMLKKWEIYWKYCLCEKIIPKLGEKTRINGNYCQRICNLFRKADDIYKTHRSSWYKRGFLGDSATALHPKPLR